MPKNDKVSMGGVYEMQAIAQQNGWEDFGVNHVSAMPGSDSVNVQIRPMPLREDVHPDKAQLLRDSAGDLVTGLLHYDRKDDDDLSRADVVELIRSDTVKADEIVACFRSQLEDDIKAIKEG